MKTGGTALFLNHDERYGVTRIPRYRRSSFPGRGGVQGQGTSPSKAAARCSPRAEAYRPLYFALFGGGARRCGREDRQSTSNGACRRRMSDRKFGHVRRLAKKGREVPLAARRCDRSRIRRRAWKSCRKDVSRLESPHAEGRMSSGAWIRGPGRMSWLHGGRRVSLRSAPTFGPESGRVRGGWNAQWETPQRSHVPDRRSGASASTASSCRDTPTWKKPIASVSSSSPCFPSIIPSGREPRWSIWAPSAKPSPGTIARLPGRPARREDGSAGRRDRWWLYSAALFPELLCRQYFRRLCRYVRHLVRCVG